MNRDEILTRLRENEAVLRSRGVAHAALFGSRARGDQRPGSDTTSWSNSIPLPGLPSSIMPR